MTEACGKISTEVVEKAGTEDEVLVRRILAGERGAFEKMISMYGGDISKFAQRLIGWRADVEDIVQDVFLAAYEGLGRFRFQCALKTWLFRITINKCRTYRYKQKLRLKFFSQAADHALTGISQNTDGRADEEIAERVRCAVRSLPNKYREVIVLRYLEQLGADEIKDILKISQSALHTRLSRARKYLENDLAQIMEKE